MGGRAEWGDIGTPVPLCAEVNPQLISIAQYMYCLQSCGTLSSDAHWLHLLRRLVHHSSKVKCLLGTGLGSASPPPILTLTISVENDTLTQDQHLGANSPSTTAIYCGSRLFCIQPPAGKVALYHKSSPALLTTSFAPKVMDLTHGLRCCEAHCEKYIYLFIYLYHSYV